MKRPLLTKSLKQTFLAVPAAALMLGAAQAGTTVGLNFQAWYYDSGTTPQTVGFGAGYQTTGFPVTAKAFGVNATNWWNTDPLNCQSAISGYATFNTATTFAGSLTANITATSAWQTGIGALNEDWVSETVTPGNNEVTWGILDNTGWSVSFANLNSLFPNGYVVQAIAAGNGKVTANSQVFYTDGTTFTNNYYFGPTYSVNGAVLGGYEPPTQPVGLSLSTNFTSDALTISSPARSATNANCAISGFIFTDMPVVTWMGNNPTNAAPLSTSELTGTALTLNASAIGILPLSYQWQLNGTNIPGAIFANYTNLNATASAGGNYKLIVTNLYGSATSEVASVTILAPALTIWSGSINGTWDIGTTANWTTNGVATKYVDGSLAQFDDTAVTTGVNVAAPVSPFNLTVTNDTKAYTLGGSPITGATSLTKSGTNTLMLTGVNTFNGGINLNGGTLTIGNAGQLGGGSYSGVIANNGNFIWASSAGQTNTGVMSGSGLLTLNGSGLLSMGANALVTNGVIVNSGTLRVSANNFGGAFTPRIVINTNGTVLGDSVHALGGNSSIFINHGTWLLNDEDYKQNLAMIDGLIALGGGGDGQGLRVGSAGGAGNWTWNFSNSIAGSFINSSVQFVGAGSVLTMNVQRGAAASDLTINGIINGTVDGTLIFTGNGITTLNGANSTAAGMTVSGGTVIVNAAAGSGMTTVTTNGTLLIAPNAILNGSATIGGTFALTPAGGIGQVYVGGAITMTADGKTILKIAKDGGSPVSDNLYANILTSGNISYNGTLVLTNVTADGTPLAAGDTFTLFSGASGYNGSFTSFILPTLPVGLSWDYSQLLTSGSITVSAAAAPPFFSPAPGNYFTPQTVTINTLTPGATIYYTTDGSTPTGSSPHGSAPVTVNVPANVNNFTIQAYATASGYSPSAVVTGIYSITTPTWITPSGGSWQATGNWSNNVIANAAGAPADFSELTLPSAPTVTLDGSPTVGSISFADIGNTYGWTIALGSGSGNKLTLNNGTNTPVINVQNQTVTITNTPLAGTQGLAKNGAGTLVLTGTGSTYTGNTIVNGGTLVLSRGGGSGTLTSTNITVNPGATLSTSVGDALGYSGSQWVRIININGGQFTNTSTANEGWGLTFNLMGGIVDFGTNGGIAAGNGTIVNTLATNITSRISGKFIIRESNPNNQVVFNIASGTASPDLLVSGVISQSAAGYGIVKTGAGIMSLTATNTYAGLTAVSNGTLLVTGSIASTNVVANGLLIGNGKFTGPTTIQSGGTLQPGLGGGDTSTLIISNKLTLAGNVLITVNRTNGQNSSRVTGISTLTYGGALTVTNAGATLLQGDTFTLFAATNYVGNFTTTNLPTLSPGLSWAWAPTSGTLSVVATQTVNPNPTNIVASFSGNSLTLSWPTDHTGWRLLAQTNHLDLGLSSNTNDWGTVSGSTTTNQVIITVDPTKAAGFYRMIYP